MQLLLMRMERLHHIIISPNHHHHRHIEKYKSKLRQPVINCVLVVRRSGPSAERSLPGFRIGIQKNKACNANFASLSQHSL